MSLLNDLEGSLFRAVEGEAVTALTGALQNSGAGGVSGILNQLRQNGMDQHVSSWTGPGQNMPISPQQLASVLNNEHVRQIAAQMGLPTDQILQMLSQVLPGLAQQHAQPQNPA